MIAVDVVVLFDRPKPLLLFVRLAKSIKATHVELEIVGCSASTTRVFRTTKIWDIDHVNGCH
jgi:hypothetical protein